MEQMNQWAMTNIDNEMILMAENGSYTFSNFTWITDSGATTLMTNSLVGMFNQLNSNTRNRLATEERWRRWRRVNREERQSIRNGRRRKLLWHVPELMVNLFSPTAIMEKDFDVDGTNKGINIKKGEWSMRFNTRIRTPKRQVFATTMIPERHVDSELADISIRHEDAHQLLGYPGRNRTFRHCREANWVLSNQVLNQCEDCLIGKPTDWGWTKKPEVNQKYPVNAWWLI